MAYQEHVCDNVIKSNGNEGKHWEEDSKDLADQVLGSGCLPHTQCHLRKTLDV